ncbi:putative histone-lysine N-methyltransferase 1 isoform X2 [Ptychodera flava]|uniref:putative histone-lysine N-methyltransferase 1 isoform X2 n=1 Tax=Ptychodera flava TaxID=63121 RepID=UPI00396A5280
MGKKSNITAFLSRSSSSSAEESASISWKFDFGKFKMEFGALRTTSDCLYENASVTWKIHDGANTNRCVFPCGDEKPVSLHKLNGASSLVLSAFLRGGSGEDAWSTTRLFHQTRMMMSNMPYPFEMWVQLRPGEDIEKWEKPQGKSFTLTKKERDRREFHVKYTSLEDHYVRVSNDSDVIHCWKNGIYAAENISRHEEENDFTYLSRKDGQTPDDSASITWKFDFGGYQLESGSLLAWSGIHHESASILWKLQDSMNPHRFIIPSGAKEAINLEEFKGSSSLVLSAFLCGGLGENGKAWQHAQLFRQNRHSEQEAYPFEIKLKLTKAVTIFDKIEEMSIAAMNNDMDYLKEVLDCVTDEYGISELSIIHTNSQGDTPLHVAMKFNSVDVAICLMETFPALLGMTNRENKLPMDYASIEVKSAIEEKKAEDKVLNSQTDIVNDNKECGTVFGESKDEVRQDTFRTSDECQELIQLSKDKKSREANGNAEKSKLSKKEKVKRAEDHAEKGKLQLDKRNLQTSSANTTNSINVKLKGKNKYQIVKERKSKTSSQPAENGEKIQKVKRMRKDIGTVENSETGLGMDNISKIKEKKRKSINSEDGKRTIPAKHKRKISVESQKESVSAAASTEHDSFEVQSGHNTEKSGKASEQNNDDSSKLSEKRAKKKRKRDDVLDDDEMEKLRQERNFKPGDLVAVNGEGLDEDAYWIGKIRRIEGDIVEIHWYDKDFKGRYKPQFLRANNKAYVDSITEDTIMEKVKLVKGKVCLK